MAPVSSIFEKRTKNDLREFVSKWAALQVIDETKAFDLACAAMKYYKGDKSERINLREFQDLEKQWYDSLAKGEPDYSVYGAPYFLSDIWACWVLYSRKYLLSARAHIISDMQVRSVADLGCGFGYTTAGLKELFPSATVFGTNFEGCLQWKFAAALGKERGFALAPDVQSLNRNIDLVFASEYFEHIEEPVAHLAQVLSACNPKYLVIANSFGTTSVGHFFSDKQAGRRVSRAFNATLRGLGYEKMKTKCWNDRPTFWKQAKSPDCGRA
jgi:SAM-dependent methyltransferase